MQNRIISRFWFCRWLGRFKINIRWTLVYFWKSNICTNKLDVQETDFGLTQLNRSRVYISWCRFTHGWNTSSWSLRFGYGRLSLFSNTSKENPKIKHEETRRVTPHQTSTPKTKLKIQPNTTILSWVMLVMFRRTRSLLYLVRCFTFLRTIKPWLRW